MKFKKTAAVLLAAVMALSTAILPQKTGLTAVAEADEPEEEQLELKIVNNITAEPGVNIEDVVTISSVTSSADDPDTTITNPETVKAGDWIWVGVFYETGYYLKNVTIDIPNAFANGDAAEPDDGTFDHAHFYGWSVQAKADTDNPKAFTVTISGELVEGYPIFIDEYYSGGGTVTVDKETAKPGEKVKVTASSNGYQPLKEIRVKTPIGSDCFAEIEDTDFIVTIYDFTDDDGYHTIKSGYVEFEMPESEVIIDVRFGVPLDEIYIVIEETQNGTVSVDPKKAEPGETVTITTTPDEGYELDSIEVVTIYFNWETYEYEEKEVTVTDGKFTMPENDVIITVTFKKSANQPETSAPAIPPASQPTGNTGTSEPAASDPETSEPTTSEPAADEPTVFEPVINNAETLDEDTKEVLRGITVTDSNSAFEDGVVMNVSFIEKTDELFRFDITFTKDGKEVQPNGKVTVKVPVPETMKNGDIYVYHYDDNGNAELIPSKAENGFVIFETDRFSVYALSDELIEDDAPDTSTPDTSKPASDSTSNPVSNPSTGIGFAFVPVLIAAGAVIASAKKRK